MDKNIMEMIEDSVKIGDWRKWVGVPSNAVTMQCTECGGLIDISDLKNREVEFENNKAEFVCDGCGQEFIFPRVNAWRGYEEAQPA